MIQKKIQPQREKGEAPGCVYTWTGRSPRWINLTPRTKNNEVANNEFTSAAEKFGYKVKARIVEENGIIEKLGTRKGSQGHPPWFEKQSQVMHTDLHFMRHPRADADPQSSTSRQKVSTKQKS